MVPAPMAVGLTLCHYAAVEEGGHDVTLAGCFLRIWGDKFPFAAPPFYVFGSLIGGSGEGTVELVISELETDEEMYAVQDRLEFLDRLTEARVLFQLENCSFPRPGEYLFTMLLDGEWMAQRRIVVSSLEDDT
jgi:hypothetical protein